MTLKVLGVDASNIRSGGGLTHLIELLNHVNPHSYNFKYVVIWGGFATLNALQDKPWLIKRNPYLLNKNLLCRTLWQLFGLSNALREEGCDILLVPGGSYIGNFSPAIVMCQNLLPFEFRELIRYGLTFFSLKLILLRVIQSFSFKKADGLIFLNEYAQKSIFKVTGRLGKKICIIPHGINQRFFMKPRLQHNISKYTYANPYRVLYVSSVDQYKHQWHVAKAVTILRQKGIPVILDLVGSSYLPAMRKLQPEINVSFVNYHGVFAFNDLHKIYALADLGLFASSCENMPNILLEKMASGLPIACSNMGPMPEILGDSAVYFDPEQPEDIASALLCLIKSPSLRKKLSEANHLKAKQYSWQKCSTQTFNFLTKVLKE